MAPADRVDKGWQKSGLKAYSTGAILGTLAHYGVRVDEAAFREATKDSFPMHVAHTWFEQWKGTGQFSRFPYSAAVELFRRVWPERIVPTDLAEALAALINALNGKAAGAQDAPVSAAFEKVSALEGQLPAEPEVLERLMEEVVMHLGEGGVRAFDELAEQLAKKGHLDEAGRFAALEERLLPERRGVATAVVRAASGEKDAALGELRAILNDGSRTGESRVMAMDALIHLEAYGDATSVAEGMLDAAEKAQDFHLALALCERLAFLYEQAQQWNELRALADRARALADAHNAAHPHHAHG